MIQIIRKNVFTAVISLCLLASLLLIAPSYVSAAETEGQIQHVYDKAGLLSTSELNDIEDMCIEYGNDAKVHIFILTHNDPNAVDGDIYIENFYDENYSGDSIILLVDMYNRDIILQGYGLAETYLHSKRTDVIREDITPYLSDEDYVTAFERYIKASAEYMKDDSELNYDHDYSYDRPNSGNNGSSSNYTGNGSSSSTYREKTIFENVWFQLGASLIIGIIAVSIMAHNAGGKMTAGANNYIDMNHSGLIGRRDDYIRTTVTRVRKPEQNNNNSNNGRGGFNAGGFRGGVSAGGHSHSTSRGKF